MNKLPRRQPWTCAKCLRQIQIQKRTNANVATAVGTPDSSYYENAHVGTTRDFKADETLLRHVFNDQSAWRDFSMRAKSTSGLIGNRHLTEPRGFQRFAESSLQKCKELVERVLSASTLEQYKTLPRDLDRLSDLLCRVIDLSDFVRTIHPNQNVAAAASAAYSLMFQYMNELNTTTGLNKQLRKAWDIDELQSQWTREEKMVAVILMKDFSKSGIDLPDAHREEFVNTSNDIANVGTDFVNGMEYQKGHVRAYKSQLNGMDPRYLQAMSRFTQTDIPVYSTLGKHIMTSAHDSDIKKKLYTAERTASTSTINRLEQLLLKRAELAKLTGYDTYAQLNLTDKMSKTPEAVTKFLLSLSANNRGQLRAELDQLLAVKCTKDPAAVNVEAWEHTYLVHQLKLQTATKKAPKSRLLEAASNYFAVGHVIQGLSSLFQSLYGVRLVPREAKIGEVTGQTKHHQTPIIALVCDFPDNSGAAEPSTLSPTSVTTLFHEMGHAVHSILGQTSMQGISGTRCATDFAELPSVLMEYFATDPAVLKLFARDWRTGELIPDELVNAMLQEKQDRAEQTGGWDNQTQILMAILDQVYHGAGPVQGLAGNRYDSTAAFHDVWNNYSIVREPAGTAWQGFFGHLYGYGATYYSYLFDRAIARQVWRAVFRDGEKGAAIEREAGERFKQEVLRYGGGRDPWHCLEGLMGDGRGVLAEGGSQAMDLVGQWGVGAGSEGQM
ncbi:Mitochondrial intermediate peptidase [Exophiala xenobiotica]|uniref:Mitochondrial intermediate peptidase n=1 Tax=Lithohypha guttulata TaxID=1690604 RepID=A0ABR0KM48_9EURO|nr:Mitochondrial intermediate peptidase [Lithohypha guttulata]KAK5327080.1 Mitochondrial intermediate peptidase [Exophiala xenobiotica]